MSSRETAERIVPLAAYADEEAKLALLFGKWWKHYLDALGYLDELRFGEQKFFIFPIPTERQLAKGRDEGLGRLDVELSLPVKMVSSGPQINQPVYDRLLVNVTSYYLSRGLDDLQESVPPAYRVAAASDVSYIDKNTARAYPKRAALNVEAMAQQIVTELQKRREKRRPRKKRRPSNSS